jgi:hypothetical protein
MRVGSSKEERGFFLGARKYSPSNPIDPKRNELACPDIKKALLVTPSTVAGSGIRN